MTKAAMIRAAIGVAGKSTGGGKALHSTMSLENGPPWKPMNSVVSELFGKVGTASAYGKSKKKFYAFMTEGLDVRREISWH